MQNALNCQITITKKMNTKIGKKIQRKSSIVDIQLGSKYALASGRYWQEKLIVEKFESSLTLIWKHWEKNCYRIQRRIYTQSNIYDGALLGI